MEQQDWPALYSTFEELASFEEGEPSEDQQIVESLLRQPKIRAAVAEALTTDDDRKKQRLLEELAGTHPDTLEVQYLYVSRVFGSIYIRGGGAPIHPNRESQIRTLLEHIEKVPKAVDMYIVRLLYYAKAAIQSRNLELAQRIGDILLRFSTDPVHRFRAEKLIEHIEFKRSH